MSEIESFFICQMCANPSPCKIRHRCALAAHSDSVGTAPLAKAWPAETRVKVTGTNKYNGMLATVMEGRKLSHPSLVAVVFDKDPYKVKVWLAPHNLLKVPG